MSSRETEVVPDQNVPVKVHEPSGGDQPSRAANETIYRNIDSRHVYLGKKLTSALNLRELSVIPNIIPLLEEHFQ